MCSLLSVKGAVVRPTAAPEGFGMFNVRGKVNCADAKASMLCRKLGPRGVSGTAGGSLFAVTKELLLLSELRSLEAEQPSLLSGLLKAWGLNLQHSAQSFTLLRCCVWGER